METEERTRDYIVYLETDVTVRAINPSEAERLAKHFVEVKSLSPLVKIDEVRRQKVIVSERKPRD